MNSKDWYVSQFPESMFLCAQNNITEYTNAIIKGHALASSSSVLVLGIARNIERVLPYTIARIKALTDLFKYHHVYVFENDSKDNTLGYLNTWAAQSSHVVVESANFNPPPFNDPHGYDRRLYMAMARNRYLEYARRYMPTHLTDYVIIVDMDLYGGWSYHGVLNTIGNKTAWDMVGSNSLCYTQVKDSWHKLFYDSWAFRPLDHPEAIEDQEANLFQFNRGEPMVAVNSVFGGLGVYKPHVICEDVEYTSDDCDHPTLHNRLRELDYNIYINPSQITLYNKTVYTI